MRLSFIPAAAAAALQLLTASCAGTDASGNSYFGTVETAEAVSVVKSSDGKAVVVDREGKELAGPFDALGELHDGRMVYRTGEYTDSTTAAYGYVDEKGSTVIPAVYASASDFSEGLAFVAPRDSSLRAIDRDGKVVFTVPDAVTVNVFMGGYAQASDISGRVWLLDRVGDRLECPTWRHWTWPPTCGSWPARTSPSCWCPGRTGPRSSTGPLGRGSAPLCPAPCSAAACWVPYPS